MDSNDSSVQSYPDAKCIVQDREVVGRSITQELRRAAREGIRGASQTGGGLWRAGWG